MHIVLVERSRLPALLYGGTERVVWWLAKGLREQGHQVTLIAGNGSFCPFANVIVWKDEASLPLQIPDSADVVHFHFPYSGRIEKPHLFTVHGNGQKGEKFPLNSVFVSNNHAKRHGSEAFVYNGLDPTDYPSYQASKPGQYVHFLGHAAWKVKNLKGAIQVASLAGQKLKVGGGHRLNLNMGIRFYPQTHVRFLGMVGGEKKDQLLKQSRALVFPVRWHEPFGLAITESMLYGNPVFATPYGSLKELVTEEVGLLADNAQQLAYGLKHWADFPRKKISERIIDSFSYQTMTKKYLQFYEWIQKGEAINFQQPESLEGNSTLLNWTEH